MTGTTHVANRRAWWKLGFVTLACIAASLRPQVALCQNVENTATMEPTPPPRPQSGLGARSAPWNPPTPEVVKQQSTQSDAPPRVRIGLRLTPFKKVVTRARDGRSETRFIPAEPLRHTLRARLNKTNHFFVGEWHIETVPTRWVRKSRRYEVKLNIYRRYGAFGQLEETLGSVDLAGVLEEQDANLFVLLGVARKRLRDKFLSPSLDVVAGFARPEQAREVAKGPGSVTIPEPPIGTNSGAILRGRM